MTMSACKRMREIEAELDFLCAAPVTDEDRIEELEEEYRSLAWEFDARIY